MTTGSFSMVVSSVFYVGSQPSGRLGKQLPSDQPAADLGSSRADLVELRVAPQAPGRVIVDVAVAAETLDRLARHPGRFLGGVKDRASRVLARGLAAVAGLADRVHVGATGVERRVHVGELSLHQLELADRLPELLALMEVRDDHIHARLHNAQGPAREHGALVVETRHQDVHSLARLRQYAFLRHLAVLENKLAGVRAAHAQLVELLRRGKSPETSLDDKGGDH